MALAMAGTISWRATLFAPCTSPFMARMKARARHAP